VYGRMRFDPCKDEKPAPPIAVGRAPRPSKASSGLADAGRSGSWYQGKRAADQRGGGRGASRNGHDCGGQERRAFTRALRGKDLGRLG
jgi:hypothetical protein